MDKYYDVTSVCVCLFFIGKQILQIELKLTINLLCKYKYNSDSFCYFLPERNM